MSLAPPYNPTASFSNDETNQVSGRSTVRTVAVDTELANISTTVNALKSNLEKLQRDDDKLRDFLVEPYALAEQTRALIAVAGKPRGLWVTGTVYAVGDVVQQSGIAYQCYTAHTASSPFTANGFWIAISGDGSAAASATSAANSATSASTSASTATTKAGEANTSATNAANSATNAANSATNAANSATSAANSATASDASASSSGSSFNSFDARYLGAKSADPTVNNQGGALAIGALYLNTGTTPNVLRAFTSTGWMTPGDSSLVTFLQSGTGAVTRTTQTKLREFVSVKDFGALGDGVTSDTAAFQAAYDAVTANGTIFVPPGAYNIGSITGSKEVIWLCFGATNAGGSAPLTLPSVSETFFSARKLIQQNLGKVADYAAFQLQRQAAYTGGVAGNVNSGFRVDHTVGSGVANFEWGITSVMENSAAAGENVAVYGQGNKRAVGPTWAMVAEARDLTNTANPAGALVGMEIDVFANGTDANNSRIGIDLVAGKATPAGALAQIYAGIRVAPQNIDPTQAYYSNGILFQGDQTTAINIATTGANTTWGLRDTGNKPVGIELAAAYSAAAIRVAAGNRIAFNLTDTVHLRETSGVLVLTGSHLQMSNSFGVPSSGNTSVTASVGASGAPPAQVAGYLIFKVDGTNFKIPYYGN